MKSPCIRDPGPRGEDKKEIGVVQCTYEEGRAMRVCPAQGFSAWEDVCYVAHTRGHICDFGRRS